MLPIVVVIWGLFFFRLFDACTADPESANQEVDISSFKAPKATKKKNYELFPLERDPFLGIAYTPKKTKTNDNRIKEEIKWPNIQYLGLVADANASKKIFILNINGTQYLLPKGETVQEVTLLSGNEGKAFLRFKGQRKEFPKS